MNPCYANGVDCPKRTAGCHATCPEGLAADAERRERKEKINKIKQDEFAAMGIILYGISKVRRDQNIRRAL